MTKACEIGEAKRVARGDMLGISDLLLGFSDGCEASTPHVIEVFNL